MNIRSLFATLSLAVIATPATAATNITGSFTFALFDENSAEVGPLTVEVGFRQEDAFLSADGSEVIFPSDSGEGLGLTTLFRFSGAGVSSGDVAALQDRYRSVFFDVVTSGPILSPNDGFQIGTTSFADYGTDGDGCMVGMAAGLLGLGSTGSDCRYLTFDSAIMSGAGVASFTEDQTSPPVPSLPEPSTWATMLLGFSMLALVLRRKGRGVRRPAAARTACADNIAEKHPA